MNVIELTALTKYYGKARGIIDLNLAVKEGDFFGFIGPNGAGKSTSIRILLGLIAPTSGTVQVFGRKQKEQPRELLKQIGYMPSEASFYPNMRVEEVLRFSAGLRGCDCRAEAEQLLSRLDLDPKKKIRALSLGNRKKVSIVCALQHQPRLCVLDEPTSGLDPLMQREFYAILKERNQQGTTIFLSSHVLSEVQRYCSHAAIIRKGRIVAVDEVRKLGYTGAKRVVLRGVEEPPQLDQIKDVVKSDGAVSFLYSGGSGALLQALAAMPVLDVTIGEPDLEEIFLHYYGEERANDAFLS